MLDAPLAREPIREQIRQKRVRLCFASLLVAPLVLLASTPSSTALTCLPAPENVAEITITGDIAEGDWYREAEVPVVIGIVAEGTPADVNVRVGDRLALIEVIAGLRLNEVQTHVDVVADDFIGRSWPARPYTEGDYVFLRVEDGVDPDDGLPVGLCSWGSEQRYTEEQINALLVLAEEQGVPIAFPTVEVEEPDPEPPPTSAPEPSTVGISGTSAALIVGLALVGLAGLIAGGYFALRNRH